MTLEFEHVAPAPVSPLATEHMVRMRDGVRLATDVYLPDGLDGATEAVLVRLPYDKCGDYCFMPRLAPLFTAEGYITSWRPGDVMAVGPLHGTHEPPFYVCGSDQWVCGYMEGAVRTGRGAARAVLADG